jgi:hypothetical protein
MVCFEIVWRSPAEAMEPSGISTVVSFFRVSNPGTNVPKTG